MTRRAGEAYVPIVMNKERFNMKFDAPIHAQWLNLPILLGGVESEQMVHIACLLFNSESDLVAGAIIRNVAMTVH